MSTLEMLISLFAALSSVISGDDPCRFVSPLQGVIDLTSLGRIDGKAAYPDVAPSIGDNYAYSYNPCKPFSEGSGCGNVSICQVSKDGKFAFPIGPPLQNCSIDGTDYTSDKQVIQSFPFDVTINPFQPQPSPPTSSYAKVDIHGYVIELTLVNIVSPPSAIFCLSRLQALSFLGGTNLTISPEILRLSSSLKSLIVTNSATPLVLPVELFSLSALTVLSFVNCGLERLSEVINQLTQLSQLTLDQNQLTTLPATLGKMSSLTLVSVSNNPRLSTLASLFGSTSIVTLLASNCTIDSFLWQVPNLQTIDLSGNRLRSLNGIETVRSPFRNRFLFGNNYITSLPDVAPEYNSTLRYFDLSYNSLVTLPDWVYSQNWDTFNIRFNKFSAKETEWIHGIFRMTNVTAIM